jgi:thiol:disulfide interchange protein
MPALKRKYLRQMRRLLLSPNLSIMKLPGLILSLLVLFFTCAATAQIPQVIVSVVSELKTAVPGQPFRVAVKIEHPPHVHTYGKELPADGTGETTTLTWTLPKGWQVAELPWPAVKEVPSTGGTMSKGYDGTIYLPATITPAGKIGDPGNISVKVRMLICDDKSCMKKAVEAVLNVPLADQAEADPAVRELLQKTLDAAVAPPAGATMTAAKKAAAVPARSFAVYLGFAFIGGLILNIMPCVFPVLGIKVLGIVQQAGGDRRQVVLHGFMYTFGVLVCFWALGGLVVALGQTWGFQLQSPSFLFGLAAFFLIFGLNMAGLFEIGASAVGVGADLQSKHGYGGSFFSGLLATVVATPCSAPFLGSALGFAVTLPTMKAMLMFSMIGIGLASPFLLLSFAPGLVAALPRPGAWMESFKQAMSFLLFGTVAYLLWVLIDKVEGLPMLFLLFGLILLAVACWIYGRWFLPHKSARTRTTGIVLAIAFAGAGLWLGWPQPEEKWETWSPERVAELRAEGKPVYIDFTAKWCLTCQVNKRVYKDRSLKKLFADKKVVRLKADLTNENEPASKALADLGKVAIPVNVLYIPGKDEPLILKEILTVENVSAALNQVE